MTTKPYQGPQMMQFLNVFLKNTLSIFLPTECLRCKTTEETDQYPNLCTPCWRLIFKPGKLTTPDYTSSYAGEYSEGFKSILLAAKYRADPFANALLRFMLIKSLNDQTFDYVTSVPGVPERTSKRHIDLPYVLAKAAAKNTNLQFEPDLIQRQSKALDQIGLGKSARMKNLVRTFVCRRELHGKNILVIDDVYTTGATAKALTQALQKAGARAVHIHVLARTPLHLLKNDI